MGCLNAFVANLPMSLSAKEFLKSVNICGSCGQEFNVLFFDSRSHGVVQVGNRIAVRVAL